MYARSAHIHTRTAQYTHRMESSCRIHVRLTESASTVMVAYPSPELELSGTSAQACKPSVQAYARSGRWAGPRPTVDSGGAERITSNASLRSWLRARADACRKFLPVDEEHLCQLLYAVEKTAAERVAIRWTCFDRPSIAFCQRGGRSDG